MKLKIKSIIFTFLISSFVLFPMSRASAAVSWPDLLNAAFDNMLEQVSDQMLGSIMAALKQAAAETVSTTVNNMIAGASMSGAMFIADWENYLFTGPQSKTNLFMNDFFSVTTRGRHANTNYLSKCGNWNYSNYLVDNAKKYTVEIDLTGMQTDLEEFLCEGIQLGEGHLSDASIEAKGLFNNGWRAFSAWSSKSANNPAGYILMAQEEQMKEQEKNEKEALAKATAYQGYKAAEQNGVVVSPGSLVKDMHSDSNDLSNKILAAAKSVPEVITATVVKVATGVIKTGIGSAQSYVQGNINKNIKGMYGGVNDSLSPTSGSSRYYRPSY